MYTISKADKNHGYIGVGNAQNSYDNPSSNGLKNQYQDHSGRACIITNNVPKEVLIKPL